MGLQALEDNREIGQMLYQSIADGHLHHAYLFESPKEKQGEELAVAFAQALLCQKAPAIGCGKCSVCHRIQRGEHIDVTMVEPNLNESGTVKSIRTKDIENLQERLRMTPYEGKRNIAIIKSMEVLGEKAANKFLKTLEEPPLGTVIIMVAENTDNMLPTILSRTMHIRLGGEQATGSSKDMERAKELIAALEEGEPYYRVRKLIEKYTKNAERRRLTGLLDSMEEIYREHMIQRKDILSRQHIFVAIEAIEKARKDILMNSIIVNNALKDMVLTIGG